MVKEFNLDSEMYNFWFYLMNPYSLVIADPYELYFWFTIIALLSWTMRERARMPKLLAERFPFQIIKARFMMSLLEYLAQRKMRYVNTSDFDRQ
jgi:hypothetical protein